MHQELRKRFKKLSTGASRASPVRKYWSSILKTNYCNRFNVLFNQKYVEMTSLKFRSDPSASRRSARSGWPRSESRHGEVEVAAGGQDDPRVRPLERPRRRAGEDQRRAGVGPAGTSTLLGVRLKHPFPSCSFESAT